MNDEEAREILHRHGLRATGGRLALLALLLAADHPVSLEEAAEGCGAKGGDRATVFRNLRSLTEARIVRQLRGAGRRELYEVHRKARAGKAHAHAHAVCTRCGVVACVENLPPLPALEPGDGWRFTSSELTIWGCCPECLAK